MKEEIMRMEHVYLKRRGRYALWDFKLNIYRGEVVAAFGFSDNGIHELGDVLSGSPVERGRLLLEEKEINIRREFYPEQHGIYVVHNENNLVPDLTIAENLFLGEKKNLFAMPVSRKKQERLAQSILNQFGLEVDAKQKAREYDIYYQQMIIKLVKAYVKGAKLVVINEILELPYTQIRQSFLHVLKLLKKDGIAVLWLSQRIEFIQEIADRVVVVRDGRNVKTFYDNGCPLEILMRIAADARIPKERGHSRVEPGEVILEVSRITGAHVKDISFSVQKRQIIGIWSNQALVLEELNEILSGERHPDSGHMKLLGQGYQPKKYEDAVKCGVQKIDFMWPERQYLPDMSVTDNLLLENYWSSRHHYFLMNEQQRKFAALRYRQRHPHWPCEKWYQLTPDQQRLLLYERCLEQTGKIFLISEAFTRVNYYLMEEIIKVFHELQENNKTLLLFSMNFWDLSQVCDSICILQAGKLARWVKAEEYDYIDIWDYSGGEDRRSVPWEGEEE